MLKRISSLTRFEHKRPGTLPGLLIKDLVRSQVHFQKTPFFPRKVQLIHKNQRLLRGSKFGIFPIFETS